MIKCLNWMGGAILRLPLYASQSAAQTLTELKAAIPATDTIRLDARINISDGSNSAVAVTMDRTDLLAAVQMIHTAGFKASLRVRTRGAQPMVFMPPNPEIWLNEYRKAVKSWATWAQSAGVDDLCIGVEHDRIEPLHPEIWLQIIREVRAIFGGPLWYCMSWWYTYAERDRKTENLWFKDLDFLGISLYAPIFTQSTHPDRPPTKEEWIRGWMSYNIPGSEMFGDNLKDHFGAVALAHNQKIMLLPGLGSYLYSSVTPWLSGQPGDQPSQKVQENYYAALAEFWGGWEHLKGVSIDGAWSTQNDLDGSDYWFIVMHKPAAPVIASWFAGDQPPTPEPSTLTLKDAVPILAVVFYALGKKET